MRAALPAPNAASVWTIDPADSVARFEMTYVVFATLKGTLGAVEGALHLDARDPSRSSVTASINVASLNTGNRLRDRHLRSSDFFDAKRFPTITFRSTRVEPLDDDHLSVVGDLTIRGVTLEVELAANYDLQADAANGTLRARFTATTTLSRRAFGLGKRTPIEKSGLIASDNVTVTLDITAIEA